MRKRFVPFFTYYSPEGVVNNLDCVQSKYGLSDIFVLAGYDVFRLSPVLVGICAKTFQKRRLLKILRDARSQNRAEFEKYGKNRIAIGNENEMFLYHVLTLKSNNKGYVSAGHLGFLKLFAGVDFPERVHGRGLELTFTKMENKRGGLIGRAL